MENLYIKTDDNKVLNEKYIRWIKKVDECMVICARRSGCNIDFIGIHKVCKSNSPDSYNMLNELFEQK